MIKPLFIITFIILFSSNCLGKKEQKTMTNLNCLTEENFKIVINYIKSNGSDNTYSFNNWILEYRNDNRIAFSKSTSDKYRTLGSVINEKDSVKVYSTIILKIKHDEVKEEIKKKFCEFVQKIKN